MWSNRKTLVELFKIEVAVCGDKPAFTKNVYGLSIPRILKIDVRFRINIVFPFVLLIFFTKIQMKLLKTKYNIQISGNNINLSGNNIDIEKIIIHISGMRIDVVKNNLYLAENNINKVKNSINVSGNRSIIL